MSAKGSRVGIFGCRVGVALAGLLFALAVLSAPAALATEHEFREIFGSAEEPSFAEGKLTGLAVNQTTGDVYAIDSKRADEEQALAFAGFAGGDEFQLGNLPVSCSATATAPIVYSATAATLRGNVKAGLEAKCGANFSISGSVNVKFTNFLGNADQALMSCATLSGSGTCTPSEGTAGHAPNVRRFHSDGTPSPFSALGSNVIDGKAGSADATPQNGVLGGNFTNAQEVQVAIAPPGAAGGTAGDIYVTNSSNKVIAVFGPSGTYIGELGEYEEGPAAEGPLKGLGESCGVAVDSAGAVYVGDYDNNLVHKYLPSADPPLDSDNVANFGAVEHPCTVAAGAGPTAGAIFAAKHLGPIFKLNATTGATECGGAGKVSEGTNTLVAVDPKTGQIYAAKGNAVEQYYAAGASCPTLLSSTPLESKAEGVAIGPEGELYVSRAGKPNIEVFEPLFLSLESWTAGVEPTEATLRANINPFGAPTTYHVDWGPTEAYGNSTPEEGAGSDFTAHAVSVTLSGLSANTTYHWRMVATNEAGAAASPDHVLRTPSSSSAATDCPNQARRAGASAFLPDCRAFEMVSPVDKNGGDIVNEPNGLGQHQAYIQATPGGDKIAYSAASAFGDQPSTLYSNEYVAGREGGGWASHGVNAPLGRQLLAGAGWTANEVGAFSADLCEMWFADHNVFPLSAEGQEGYVNLYRRGNCEPGEGGFEALTAIEPPEGAGQFYVNSGSIQGVSESSGESLFTAAAALLPEARVVGAGSQLRCATEAAGTIAYRWLRNGAPIGGATASTYTTVAADMGKAIQCQVSASGEGAGSTQVANPPFVVSPAPATAPPLAPRAIPAPAQSAPLAVGGGGGQTLTCEPEGEGAWGGSPTFSYQWYRNGAAIGGATASTYAVTAGDLASAAVFQCAVTGTGAGGSATRASGGRATSPAPPEGAPTSADAAMPTNFQLYLHLAGQAKPRLVSVLPDGTAHLPATADEAGGGKAGSLTGALSADGRRAYWSANLGGGSGKIYLREDPLAAQSTNGNCPEAEPGKACTAAVSPGNSATFWAASAVDGASALYSEGGLSSGAGTLYRYDAATHGSSAIAAGLYGVAGASEDLSRIYLASSKVLAPGQKSHGKEAVEGKPNLYLYEGGSFSFIGTLVTGDASSGTGEGGHTYSVTTPAPLYHAARVSPDGRHIAFQSRAQITGFDNTDANSGLIDTEVFLYEAGGEVRCASCNPAGARPAGRELSNAYTYPFLSGETNIGAAAWIPGLEHPLHASRLLSANGKRLFFNSNDALLAHDTNGAQDVYEWEAPGEGGCDASDPDYFAQNGGCIYLISSGESPIESELWEASEDGSDVFFTTASSLVAADPGSIDLYDARVGGGFAEPEAKASCEGQACQSPAGAPQEPPRSSSAYRGPANVGKDCGASARRAAKLSRRAKRLRRHAKKTSRPRAAKRLRRKARRLAGRAHKLSRNAKRCRRANRRAAR